MSGTDLYRLVLDAERTAATPVVVDDRRAEPTRSTVSFLGAAIWDSARTPVLGARALLGALTAPRRLAGRTGQAAKGLLRFAGALRPTDRSSLTGPLDGSRRYAWTDVPMADIRGVRHRFGVTVNDVSLAAITGGFRQLLLSRGEIPTPHALRSLVPVSTRKPGEESIPDNRVSLMLPYLPVEKRASVEQFDADGRPSRATMAVTAVGLTDEQVLDYQWADDGVTWSLVKSGQQSDQHGSYTIRSTSRGVSHVRYDLDITPAIPVPGIIVRRVMRKAVSAATTGLRKRVESLR